MGGAIWWHSGTKLFINSTTFVKNSANYGGAIFLKKLSNAFIFRCVFKRNLAILAGGAIIHFGKTLFVRNTKFQANIAKGSRASSGGALYIAGNSIIKLSSCYLKSNMATHTGGGIVFRENILSIIVNTTFDHNLAVSSSLGLGGAVPVCARSRIRIFNCRFKANIGAFLGGAIFVQTGSKLHLSNCTFEHNDAGQFGGALTTFQPAKIDISCCSFKTNKAGKGGAIYHLGNKLAISNTTFNFNVAIKLNLSHGGALYIKTRSSVYIKWCSFKRNEAADGGGAISYFGNILEISNTAFQHNAAVGWNNAAGGALLASSQSNVSVSCCIFERNQAKYLGGAIYYEGNRLDISNTTFDNNAAVASKRYGDGGALSTTGSSNVNISHCYFKENKANEGGAISHYGNKLEILDTIFVKSTGSALFTYAKSGVKVCGCRFEGNKAASSDGGAICHSQNKLDIVNTTFENNLAQSCGGALNADPGSHVVIRYTSFKCNKSGFYGGAISVSENIQSLSNMTAEGNHGLHSKVTPDGMAQAESRPIVSLLYCHLEENTANWSGGAISYGGRHLYIRNTTFVHNHVVSISGNGGALDASVISDVEICNSTFKGNMATRAGGTISHMGGGNLSIKSSVFQTSAYPYRSQYFGGDIIYSSDKLALNQVVFQDINGYNAYNSLLIHTGRFQDIKIADIHAICSRGKKISVSFPKKSDLPSLHVEVFVTVSCSSCPPHSYSLSAGKLGPSLVNQTQIQCHDCPFGGNCINGHIKASDNFWGYSVNKHGQEIHFISCPFGYCCSGSQCTNYNSCATGRHGILCGKCESGFTENILNPDCLIPEECRHPWFLLVPLLGGNVYVLLFMYLQEAARILKNLLIPTRVLSSAKEDILPRIQNVFRNVKYKHQQAQPMTDDICCEPEDNEEVHLEVLQTYEFPKPDKSDPSLFPGLFKIVVFFYQTSVLFKVYSVEKSNGLIHLIQERFSAVFSLRPDGLFSQNVSWCPFDGLRPVPKLLFKTSFIVYLFIIIFTIFAISKIIKLLRNISDSKSQAYHSRMACCVLRTVLISYGTITVTCFTLLSCVQLGSFGKVLHLDGSIHCYTWWQYIVIAIVCIWIASLPFAIYTASWLMHRNFLSSGQFLLALLIPFPTVIYWIYIRITRCHKRSSETELRPEYVLDERAEEILDVIEGPFRKHHRTDTDSNYRLPWESVFIGKRLVLIFIKTFVIDLISRLYLMLFFNFLFLMHHIYVQPFSSNFLNTTDTVSTAILITICALNILPASIYMNPMAASPYVRNFAQLFRRVETILMLIFPFIIGCCVAFLVVVRILQFMIWTFNCCVRLIRRILQFMIWTFNCCVRLICSCSQRKPL